MRGVRCVVLALGLVGVNGLGHAETAAPRAIVTEGQTFAATVQLGGQELKLNGVGLRAVAWVKGYAAGLYLARRTSSPQEVMSPGGPKRLQLRMLMEAPSEEFVKAFDKGVSKNAAPADLPGMKDRMLQFDALVRAMRVVKKGDVVDLDFIPDQGLQLRHNGRVLGAPIPGHDLYAAMLAIFVGPKAIDPEMRSGLLGGPVS